MRKAWLTLTVFLVLLFGCQSNFQPIQMPDIITLKFLTEVKGESIDGTVYLDEQYVGNTTNGVLALEKRNLSEGLVFFRFSNNGRNFQLKYAVHSADLLQDNVTFTVSEHILNNFVMRFSVNETSEPIDGTAYLQNKHLGETKGGAIELNIEDLFSGTVTINGTYRGYPFEFNFDLTKDDMVFQGIEFTVPKSKLNEITFNAAKLDEDKIESFILDFLNQERANAKLKEMSLNLDLASVARQYSEKIVESGFHHTDLEGKTVSDRLQAAKIFYTVAGENLYMTGSLSSNTTERDIASMTVKGWLSSPGHRDLMLNRDDIFSHAGVGTYCAYKNCYVTLIMAGMELNIHELLDGGYCYYYSLYPISYPFDYDTVIIIDLRASSKLNIYMVTDKSALNRCGDDSIYHLSASYDVLNGKADATINKGVGLVIETNADTELYLNVTYITPDRSKPRIIWPGLKFRENR